MPYKQGFVLLLTESPTGWVETHLVTSSTISHDKADLNMVVFDPSGSHLVSSDSLGGTVLWNLDSEDTVKLLRPPGDPSLNSLLWGKDSNLLLLNSSGWIMIPTDILSAVSRKKVSSSDEPATQLNTQVDTQLESSDAIPSEPAVNAGDEDISLGDSQEVPSQTQEVFYESVEEIRKQVLRPSSLIPEPVEEPMNEATPEPVVPIYDPPVEIQSSFQPSSTLSDDYQRRYLVWNHVGNIITRDEGITSRIEIKFSNSAGKNKQETFSDTNKFSLASLAYEGAIFATELDPNSPEGTPGSSIYYHAFPGQKVLEGANDDFSVSLLADEGAVGVAVGRGWCAVATTLNRLRVFSSTGLQLMILNVPPVVSIVGSGCRLAIVYHRGNPLEDTAQLQVQILEFSLEGRTRVIADCPLSLTPQATLTWIGFDTMGALHAMDSNGCLIVLLNFGAWFAVPVLDTALVRKSVDHVYWPVCVKNGRLVYVLLNGETKPAVYPQPITSAKPYHVPILENETGKDKESQNEKARIFTIEYMRKCHLDTEKEDFSTSGIPPNALTSEEYENLCDEMYEEADKALLKVFIDACRLQRNAIASDLAKKIVLEKSLEAAMIAANHYGRSSIAQLLNDILDFKRSVRERNESERDTQDDFQYTADDTQANNFTMQYEEDPKENAPLLFRAKSTQMNAVVSPESVPMMVSKPPNPFATMGNTPHKRKSALDSIKELKGSPSPKKPNLAVSILNFYSSFSSRHVSC